MQRTLAALFAVTACSAPMPAPDAGAPDDAGIDAGAPYEPHRAQVDALMQQALSDGWLVGAEIALVDAQRVEYLAVGTLTAGGTTKPDPDSIFELGSISKAFTGTLLADMERDGLVSRDAGVQGLLPATVTVPSRNGLQITLVDLATHRSGLPRLPTNIAPADLANPYADYTVAMLEDFLNHYQLPRDPGAAFEYSNVGMGLLGHALALRAGESYEQLLHDRITGPLQLTSTVITLGPLSPHLAPGHDADALPAANWDLPALAGAGAVRSSARDLARFAQVNLGLVSSPLKASLDVAHQPLAEADGLQVGLAWFTTSDGIVFHDGETGGYSSVLLLDESRQLGVVVLSNTATGLTDAFGLELMELMRGNATHAPALETTVAVPVATLDTYVGMYSFGPGAIVTVTRDGTRLFGQLTGQPRFGMYATTQTSFYLRVVVATIDFTATGLTLTQDGQTNQATRL